MVSVHAPFQAQVVEWLVQPGASVPAGAVLVVLESMKMEHEVRCDQAGTVQALHASVGDTVAEGAVLVTLVQGASNPSAPPASPAPESKPGPKSVRADLQRLRERLAFTEDAARPEAVQRRHASGQRTARENLADLCDPGSFIEYGALAVAAQRSRRTEDDLIVNTPADGLVAGIGSVNGALFGPERGRTVVMAYDATVLAGTQGMRNHQKTDRLLGIALEQRLPVVLFAEGGGGRPGDTDMPVVAGLHVGTFAAMAKLSGRVPLVGIAAGRCFAGNAALLGCCDTIIATEGSNIGMGGPAMVEGGGLGRYPAEAIGPSEVQHANGVIDLLVSDEAEAVALARRYLSYFQGVVPQWQAPEADGLRDVVPENRLRAYDTLAAVRGTVDVDSLLELRRGFGCAIHTALARIEGRPVGILASNPLHLGGAIDADAADKAARFLQLCNAHGLPVITWIDTPGFMVGPQAEAQAQVRHASRLFVVATHLRIPVFSVVLRKAYGLGAMGLAAGGLHRPVFTIAWPTAEFGAMGLEGAVRLGFRRELEAEPEGPRREALFQQLLAQQVANGTATQMATTLEIDAVIDPADTRHWITRGLQGAHVNKDAPRGFIDPW